MKLDLARQYFVTLRDSKVVSFSTDIDFAPNVKNSYGDPRVYFELKLFFNHNRIRIELRFIDNLIYHYEPQDGDILKLDEIKDISSKTEDEIVKELCEKITTLEKSWYKTYGGFKRDIELYYNLLFGYVNGATND